MLRLSATRCEKSAWLAIDVREQFSITRVLALMGTATAGSHRSGRCAKCTMFAEGTALALLEDMEPPLVLLSVSWLMVMGVDRGEGSGLEALTERRGVTGERGLKGVRWPDALRLVALPSEGARAWRGLRRGLRRRG